MADGELNCVGPGCDDPADGAAQRRRWLEKNQSAIVAVVAAARGVAASEHLFAA